MVIIRFVCIFSRRTHLYFYIFFHEILFNIAAMIHYTKSESEYIHSRQVE